MTGFRLALVLALGAVLLTAHPSLPVLADAGQPPPPSSMFGEDDRVAIDLLTFNGQLDTTYRTR